MKKKVIDLYKYYENTVHYYGFVLPPASAVTYPTIEGNTSNFINDYNAAYAKYDRYFINDFGSRTYYSIFEPETDAEIYAAWQDDVKAVLAVYLDSWARLYYALSLQYNPIYNVDGETVTTYSQKQLTDLMGARSESDIIAARDRSDIMGARSETDTIGQKETTNGARTDTTTDYSVSFDVGTEKETGKSSDSLGSQTITEGAQSNGHSATTYTDRHTEESHTDTHSATSYTDTHTTGQHTETEVRKGNIGVTMTQQMLNAEFEVRKRNFFHEIFVIMSHELGLYYEMED